MAEDLPAYVQKALAELGKRIKHLHVMKIKGTYYVYEERTIKIGTQRTTPTFYLGKINTDGTFEEAKHRTKSYTRASSFDEMLNKRLQLNPADELVHPDAIDLQILQDLSTNARKPVTEIANELGIGKTAAYHRIEKLEQRYKIKYTLEIAVSPFNLLRFVVLVKFLNDKPSPEDMKKVLEQEPTVLFAALLKGDYDLFIYMLAGSIKELEDKLYELRSLRTFAPYESLWNVTYIHYSYGYMPLREKFFDLVHEKIWHRSKETPRKKEGMLTEREYLVLKELNENSREDFAEIDKKLGLNSGAAQYTYYSLLEKEIILRPTIEMRSLPIKYNILFVCPQTDLSVFNLHRREYLMHLIDLPKTPTSTYTLVGDIGLPYGVLFIAPSYSGNLQESEDLLSRFLKGAKINSNIIVEILVGSLGYRRIDPKVTYQYPKLQEMQQQENQQMQQTQT